ncbi:hypothetical protein M2901_05465 [Vagococcus lutrae]|uniref:hypothetical protein n=1 Tax=Vagococcus lutrae TaxID=81947 RepID=UPI00200FF6A9|nr:hypothetical protein [Vagococcus lutrae]UQF70238.1 hypothetical protein M2901_05465 [Vagococcus lutrae]
MMEFKKNDLFCGHSIKDIDAGGLDEIYCYIHVKDLFLFMVDLFELDYKPNWIRIETGIIRGKEDYEVRLCFKAPYWLTLDLSYDERKKFAKKFLENITNSPIAKYQCKFQLFYMENGKDDKGEDVVVVSKANLATISSVCSDSIKFEFSGDVDTLECQLNESNCISVITEIKRKEYQFMKLINKV